MKQIATFHHIGITDALCRHKSALSKTSSFGFCEDGFFCGMILENSLQSVQKVTSLDEHVGMCKVYVRSAAVCKLVDVIVKSYLCTSLTSTVISSSNEDSDFLTIDKKYETQQAYRKTQFVFLIKNLLDYLG